MMQHKQGEASFHDHVSPSPSFSSYSSETLAEIAARVIKELRCDPHSLSEDDAIFQPWEQNDNFTTQNDEDETENDNDSEFEFEFAFVSTEQNASSPVSADDIFYNGQIKPMYPIFDRTLLLEDDVPSNDAVSGKNNNNNENSTTRRRLPLRKLMFEESETASCSSSTDESVDLESLTEGTYCVWNPNSVGREKKKSNSTGSGSKRWKLRNFLLRSHSDGKDKQPVVFQIPAKGSGSRAAVENDGGKNRNVDKRKSFLPYKPELVGIFANVNGLGRNLKPF